MQPELRYVDYALANNFGDYIEINKDLDEEPDLKRAILRHEYYHTKSNGLNKKDFLNDIAPQKIDNWKLLKFMLKHPKSFMQFLPFYWQKDKGFVYDINAILLYTGIIVIVGAVVLVLA